MNTNTNELRKLANRAIQECMYSDFYAAANPAAVIGLLDEIDRLTREAMAADIRIANDALVIAERDELRTKLAALEGQEPVAWLDPWTQRRCVTDYDAYGARGIPLYTAAGAAPVPVPEPEGWQLVPIEPTDAMLVSARDWSYAKYGKPIGNTAAVGCWEAMLSAAAKDARTKETK